MVKCLEPQLDSVFAALSEPVRRSVVRTLVLGERTVSDLAEPHEMTMAAVMKHIAVLEKSGLVLTEKRGRIRYCRLDTAQLGVAKDWIEETTQFWTKRLEALQLFVEENP